jgi:hypothetical protein
MELSPSWETDRLSDTQKVPNIFWIPYSADVFFQVLRENFFHSELPGYDQIAIQQCTT